MNKTYIFHIKRYLHGGYSMLRDIIEINEDECIGCGNCVPNCHQGALQIIDGKARLISDLMCEGIGACVGHCPTGAMTIEKREAEPYDEKKVMEKLARQGPNVVQAHIEHLREHKQDKYLAEALEYISDTDFRLPAPAATEEHTPHHHGGGICPGSAMRSLGTKPDQGHAAPAASELTHWPVQLHLVNPAAPYYRNADILLAADCTAYAMGDFHSSHLRGKSLAIACPKLDQSHESYIEKLRLMIDESEINTLTVLMMEVPCCSGLLQMAQLAAEQAQRKVPIKKIIVSIEGEILSEDWV